MDARIAVSEFPRDDGDLIFENWRPDIWKFAVIEATLQLQRSLWANCYGGEERLKDVRSVKDIWKQFCQIRSGISFSTTRLYHLCVFARVFHLFVMRLRSGGFRSHICLSWVCYYLWENPSHCLIQPSNHLLTVISCALLNCEQNYLAYSARCFSYGLTRRHSSNPATTQSVRREARDMNEGATWEKNMVGCMLPFVVHPSHSPRMLWIWQTTPDTVSPAPGSRVF